MKKLASILASLLLASCASTPSISYYELVEDPSKKNEQATSDGITIGIEAVQLVDAIDKKGIMLETNEGEMHVAQYHRWRRPLHESIRQFITNELNGSASNYRFQPHSTTPGSWSYRIQIEFDAFYGTENGNSIVSGFWKLIDAQDETELEKKRFLYESEIEKDGYSGLVEAQRMHLRILSSALAQAIP